MKKHLSINTEYNIFLRYLSIFILIIIFTSNYFVTPITYIFLLLSKISLMPFISTKLSGSSLFLPNNEIYSIIEACIAPSAYIFITLIILSLPLEYKRALKILIQSLIVFSIFNLLRIIILMYVDLFLGTKFFESIHLIFYEGVSGILTAFIIIYFLKKEKIKKIYPIFTDIKYLLSEIKPK